MAKASSFSLETREGYYFMTKQHDPNWYKDNRDFIKDLCMRCGLRWRNYDGLCNECKQENKRK